MTDKLHKASEIAASGLKDDPELFLSVKREIEVHLQESTERLENAGQNHDKAVETALEKFGSPAETADAIFKTNKKRLKLRARLRFLLISLMPLAALSMMVFSILPEWNNLQIKRKMFYSVDECLGKAAHAAGVNLKEITKQQKLLLENNWTELHKIFPENKAYFANYFMNIITINGYIPGATVTSALLPKAHETDPNNALYDYFITAAILRSGSTSRIRFSSGIISDRVKLMEALPYYLAGLKKQFYNNYRDEILEERLELKSDNPTPASLPWISCLRCGSIFDYTVSEYITQAIPMWGEELIKNKRSGAAEKILDSWKHFVWQNLRYDEGFYQYANCMRMLQALKKTLPPLYQKLGNPEKAVESRKLLNKLLTLWIKRWDKKSPEKVAIKKTFVKYAPHIQYYLGSMLLTGEYKLEDLTAGRLKEYIHADRILLFVVELFLSCMIIGYGICWLLIRLRLKKALPPALFIPRAKVIFELVLFGIIIPLIFWRMLILLQPGGRNYALTYCSINFMAQGLFLILGTTLWPIILMRYYTAVHARKLGVPANVDRRGIIIVPAIGFVVALLACVPWHLWITIDIIDCLDGHIISKIYRHDPDIYIVEWWHLLLVVFLFIAAARASVSGVWHKPESLFVKGAAAAAMLTVSAVILIVVVFLVDGYFYWQECRYIKLDKVENFNGRVLFRDRIVEKERSRILKVLDETENLPLKHRPGINRKNQ